MYGTGINAPTGLNAVMHLDGSTWNGQYQTFKIKGDGTSTDNLFIGDPVIIVNGYVQKFVPGDNAVGLAKFGNTVYGVLQGVKYKPSAGFYQPTIYWPGGTKTANQEDADAFVIIDKSVVYEIQVSSSLTTYGGVQNISLTQAMIGVNYNLGLAVGSTTGPGTSTYVGNPGAGSLTTGLSGFYLDLSAQGSVTAALTGTALDIAGVNTIIKNSSVELKVINKSNYSGNSFGVQYNTALVTINNHVNGVGTSSAPYTGTVIT